MNSFFFFFFSFFQEVLTSGHNVTHFFLRWLKDHDIILADMAVRWKCSILFRVKLLPRQGSRGNPQLLCRSWDLWLVILNHNFLQIVPWPNWNPALPSHRGKGLPGSLLVAGCYRWLHYTHIKVPYMYIYSYKTFMGHSLLSTSLFSWKKNLWFGFGFCLHGTFELHIRTYLAVSINSGTPK